LPPVSLAENAKVIELEDVLSPVLRAVPLPLIAETKVVLGGTVSTVHINEAGDGSLFVELSSDKTLNVWVPSPKLTEVNWMGLVHMVKLGLSILHSKLLIPTPVSLPENLNTIELDLVLLPLVIALLLPSIAVLIVVVGGTVSMPQLNDAGVRFMFPTLSSALILKI
jgi:hypothetical protein